MHIVCALRLAIVSMVRSLGFIELAEEELGYAVFEYTIAESDDNGSLVEFLVTNVSDT